MEVEYNSGRVNDKLRLFEELLDSATLATPVDSVKTAALSPAAQLTVEERSCEASGHPQSQHNLTSPSPKAVRPFQKRPVVV